MGSSGQRQLRASRDAMPSNVSVAVYALQLLGGALRFVHTEDVALKCFEMLPDRFSWRKYPQYPDTEPARSALFDAAKEKHGRLVVGDNRAKGWKLTESGVQYARAVEPEIEELVERPGKTVNVDRRGFGDIEDHRSYMNYISSRSVDSMEFHELATMLRCPVDAPGPLIAERLENLLRRTSDAGRGDIKAFLQAAASKFQRELGEN